MNNIWIVIIALILIPLIFWMYVISSVFTILLVVIVIWIYNIKRALSTEEYKNYTTNRERIAYMMMVIFSQPFFSLRQ